MLKQHVNAFLAHQENHNKRFLSKRIKNSYKVIATLDNYQPANLQEHMKNVNIISIFMKDMYE